MNLQNYKSNKKYKERLPSGNFDEGRAMVFMPTYDTLFDLSSIGYVYGIASNEKRNAYIFNWKRDYSIFDLPSKVLEITFPPYLLKDNKILYDNAWIEPSKVDIYKTNLHRPAIEKPVRISYNERISYPIHKSFYTLFAHDSISKSYNKIINESGKYVAILVHDVDELYIIQYSSFFNNLMLEGYKVYVYFNENIDKNIYKFSDFRAVSGISYQYINHIKIDTFNKALFDAHAIANADYVISANVNQINCADVEFEHEEVQTREFKKIKIYYGKRKNNKYKIY